MEEEFKIPVVYQGQELFFPARLVPAGWTHQIEVDVYGAPVLLEKDEEGAWRALVPAADGEMHSKMDAALIKELVHSLVAILDS